MHGYSSELEKIYLEGHKVDLKLKTETVITDFRGHEDMLSSLKVETPRPDELWSHELSANVSAEKMIGVLENLNGFSRRFLPVGEIPDPFRGRGDLPLKAWLFLQEEKVLAAGLSEEASGPVKPRGREFGITSLSLAGLGVFIKSIFGERENYAEDGLTKREIVVSGRFRVM